MEVHPKTGAMQLVEIRETVREIEIPQYVVKEQVKPLLFENISDDELLRYGLPEEWLEDVRKSDEDSLLELADHLPGEAAEALLDLAVGAKPKVPEPVEVEDSFDHPDSLRRFRLITDSEELERALDYPWEKWSVFLHPEQQSLIEKDYNGSARISGTAGTGKTIVALHRAVYLAKTYPDARILLTTFSDPLANVLRKKLRALIVNEPRIAERLEVYSMDGIGKRLFELNYGKMQIADQDTVRVIIQDIANESPDNKFSVHFLISEWEQVVDAWQLMTWEDYRDVLRLGRKTRLPENQRSLLWSIFDRVRAKLKNNNSITQSEMYYRLSERFSDNRKSPFDFIIVDESQDITVPQLRFLAALNNDKSNGLFFTGDLGQRIFQQPFSWKALGIDIRGRSYTLRINYRTSHQIRKQADCLLGSEIEDVDGIREDRCNAISVFNGPEPEIRILNNNNSEIDSVSLYMTELISEGVIVHEIGLFVRSPAELDRAKMAVECAGLSANILDENVDIKKDCISVCTMHLAKGLEFRAVVVMACDDDVLPSQVRIETVTDDTDLEEVYNTERHLLYVACTRAREFLLVTGVKPGSEFLDDFRL